MTDGPTTERVTTRWRIPAAVAMVVAGVGVAARRRRLGRRRRIGAVDGGCRQRAARQRAERRPERRTGRLAGTRPERRRLERPHNDGGGGRGMMGGRMGGRGMFDDITITGITGSQIALKTADGWTRTIDASGATVEKDGKTATLADLTVGDQVKFQETRGADGTYKVTAIAVVQPHVAGTVAAVDATSITITEFDGTTAKVVLTGSTTYEIGRRADKSAVTVGAFVDVRGTLAADGTLTATTVEVMPAGMTATGRMHGDGDARRRGPGAAPAARARTRARAPRRTPTAHSRRPATDTRRGAADTAAPLRFRLARERAADPVALRRPAPAAGHSTRGPGTGSRSHRGTRTVPSPRTSPSSARPRSSVVTSGPRATERSRRGAGLRDAESGPRPARPTGERCARGSSGQCGVL